MLSNVLDPEDNRGFGRVGGRDRVGQPFVGFADRAAIGQDASLLHRPQVPRPGSHHRLLRRLQVIIWIVFVASSSFFVCGFNIVTYNKCFNTIISLDLLSIKSSNLKLALGH